MVERAPNTLVQANAARVPGDGRDTGAQDPPPFPVQWVNRPNLDFEVLGDHRVYRPVLVRRSVSCPRGNRDHQRIVLLTRISKTPRRDRRSQSDWTGGTTPARRHRLGRSPCEVSDQFGQPGLDGPEPGYLGRLPAQRWDDPVNAQISDIKHPARHQQLRKRGLQIR